MHGAQIVVDYLVRQAVPYAVGIPGHGCWNLTDALLDRADEIRTLQVMHEQSAVHLADGYYRATGRPLLAFTSIGPGATNTVVGMGTAYVDSTAVALMTGSAHTYMRGHGVLQELERRHAADNPRLFEPVVKEWWQPSRVDELPFVLHRAWNQMLSGRPGTRPARPADGRPGRFGRGGRARSRPTGGAPRSAPGRGRGRGVPPGCCRRRVARSSWPAAASSQPTGSAELTALAERLGAPVVTTWMGKGAIDETHPLAGPDDRRHGVHDRQCAGRGRRCPAQRWLPLHRLVGELVSGRRHLRDPALQADPARHRPARDRQELPGRVPLLGDARAALGDLLQALGAGTPREAGYAEEIERLRRDWEAQVDVKSGSSAVPMTMARAVREIQAASRPDAIVVTGAGLPQGMVKQRWVTRQPRTHITSGGFSTMGFTLPAAIGAQLAQPERQVLAICGDGDFLQTMQELATAAMLDSPVCTVVLDNSGWISIKGGQDAFFGRTAITDFLRSDGSLYSPDYVAIGRAFGIESVGIDDPADVKPAVERALARRGPALVVINVERDLATAGPDKTGWWDVPVPESHAEQRARQDEGRSEEQHR